MLTQLLNIKSKRESRAQQAVAKQRRVLLSGDRKKQQLDEEASSYRDWRIAEEERLFLEARDNTVTRQQLDKLQQQIGLLREKQATLEQACAAQDHYCQQQRDTLRQRQAEHVIAHKALVKFEHLQRKAKADNLALQEYREEQEQDESTLMSMYKTA